MFRSQPKRVSDPASVYKKGCQGNPRFNDACYVRPAPSRRKGTQTRSTARNKTDRRSSAERTRRGGLRMRQRSSKSSGTTGQTLLAGTVCRTGSSQQATGSSRQATHKAATPRHFRRHTIHGTPAHRTAHNTRIHRLLQHGLVDREAHRRTGRPCLATGHRRRGGGMCRRT